ncbi:MAG: cyclase family protein [Saprospiraceae bacterium]|nr:cyclase family protein [Saprospiraceae bacterium]
MIIHLSWDNRAYWADLSQGFDISLPVSQTGPKCYHVDSPQFYPQRSDSFIGSVAMGGSVNSYGLQFYPHANGTHTECIGHLTKERISILDHYRTSHFICQLMTVTPLNMDNGDKIITEKLVAPYLASPRPEALALRTLPNHVDKQTRNYSGTNPPYFAVELMDLLIRNRIKHILTDLPSVDREEDNGTLSAHKAYWQWDGDRRLAATITELIYAQSNIPDGLYLLNLQVAPIALDASPSRPLLFHLEPR